MGLYLYQPRMYPCGHVLGVKLECHEHLRLCLTLTFDLDGDLGPGRLADAVGGRADVDAGVAAAHAAQLQREALVPLPRRRYHAGLQ